LPAFASRSPGIVLAFAIASAVASCTSSTPDLGSAQLAANATTTGPTAGLQITETKVGTGLTPKPGQTCVVHYTGWLYENGVKGKKFDSSVDRKAPFYFVMGEHKVIEGWERGVSSMKVGGKRTIIVPPVLGYGSAGNGAAIPPNSTLLFEIELLEVRAS
jgi:peptidylprolyl isomerase